MDVPWVYMGYLRFDAYAKIRKQGIGRMDSTTTQFCWSGPDWFHTSTLLIYITILLSPFLETSSSNLFFRDLYTPLGEINNFYCTVVP